MGVISRLGGSFGDEKNMKREKKLGDDDRWDGMINGGLGGNLASSLYYANWNSSFCFRGGEWNL